MWAVQYFLTAIYSECPDKGYKVRYDDVILAQSLVIKQINIINKYKLLNKIKQRKAETN